MKKNRSFSLRSFKRYLGVFHGIKLPWFLILMSTLCAIAMMSAELQVATMTASIIDASQNAINGKELLGYLSAAVMVGVFTVVSVYFERKMEETINLRVRSKLWVKILHLPSRFYDQDSGDELVSRVTTDATAPAALFTLAVSCVTCVVTTAQAFVQLFSYHTTLALYALMIIPLTLLLSIVYSIFQFKLGVFRMATMAGSLGYIAERVRNFRLIKSAVAEKLEEKKGNDNFKRMYIAEFLEWLMVAGYQLASSLFSILFIVIVFVIGGQLVPKGEVTVGELVSFYSITGVVTVQLMQLFMNIGSVFGTFGAMKKTAQIMETDVEKESGAAIPEMCANILLDEVSFAYHEGHRVLNQLSAVIPMGKVTAVIGGNGAGKSTLFKLLTRLYEPNDGRILYGADNIADYQLIAWRDRFAYVFQKDPLISGTVRENLTYGLTREVSEEELIAVTKEANCYDCIMAKPGGFDEDVGLGGSNFSGGQAQCISIARAMLRGAEILLLDEATSNLDVLSEAQVTEALDRLMKEKTTIMIAHNYAATRNADYVIVMKDGAVEAAGSPVELLQSNEYYQMFSKTL